MTTEIEWRRNWKPNLKTKSWKPLLINNVMYLVKYLFTDTSYEILITNLTDAWYEHAEEAEVIQRTKKLNPSVEAPLNKLLEHIEDSLDGTKEGTEFSLLHRTENGDSIEATYGITASMTTVLAGLPFNWEFQCAPDRTGMVSGHLVQPLVTMVIELHRQQEDLFKLLANKDKEIGDLKSQGARVSRKHLETPLFHKSVFKDGMVASKGFTDVMQASCGEAFNKDGQRLYEDIAVKQAWISHETQLQAVSDNESLEEDETVEGGGIGTVETGQSWLNRVPPSLQSGQEASIHPTKSPGKSPGKSPQKSRGNSRGSSADPSPVKEAELARREQLRRNLAEEENKNAAKRKKKKMKF